MCSAVGDSVCETNEVSFPVPVDLVKKTSGLSVDIGASMLKVVYRSKENLEEAILKNEGFGSLQLVSFPRGDLHRALDHIGKQCILTFPENSCSHLPTICATGTGGMEFTRVISEKLNLSVEIISEFDCFANAFVYLTSHLSRKDLLHSFDDEATVEPSAMMKEYVKFADRLFNPKETPGCCKRVDFELDISENLGKIVSESEKPLAEAEDIYPCLLVISGSATSFMIVNKDQTFRVVDFSVRGGRSFFGIGCLLTGSKTFEELIELAAHGDQQNVDIYSDAIFPRDHHLGNEDESVYTRIPNITNPVLVYSFGKAAGAQLSDFRREDLARACLNYFVTDLTHSTFTLCQLREIKRVFLCGSFCNSHFTRKEITSELVRKNLYAKFAEAQVVSFDFIKSGSHLGAMGALINATSSSNH